MDKFIDNVLEVLLFPLYIVAVISALFGFRVLFNKDFHSAAESMLLAFVCYVVARGIGKYFDLKKRGEL